VFWHWANVLTKTHNNSLAVTLSGYPLCMYQYLASPHYPLPGVPGGIVCVYVLGGVRVWGNTITILSSSLLCSSQLKRANDVHTNYCLRIGAPTLKQRIGSLIVFKLLTPFRVSWLQGTEGYTGAHWTPFHAIVCSGTSSQCMLSQYLTLLNELCKVLAPFQ